MRLAAGSRLPLLIYGLSLGAMNYLFYLSLRTVPLGIAVALEFTGPLAVAMFSSRRPIDFLWVALAIAGLWFLLPLGHGVGIDPFGAACALGAGACWAVYIIFGQKAGGDHGPGTVALGSLIAALVFCPIGARQTGSVLFNLDILPVALAVAILHRAALFAGDHRAAQNPGAHLRHLNEHGTGNGGAVRHAVPRRTPERRAMAGAGGHHRRVYGLRPDHSPQTAPRKPFLIANPPADRNAGMQAG